MNNAAANPKEGPTCLVVREGIDRPRDITYHGDGIARFNIVAYVFGDFAGTGGAKVRVLASADGQQWQEVAVAQEPHAIKDGWARVVLTPAQGLTAPVTYLRIERCCDAAVYSPQVGEVQLFTVGIPTR